MKQKTIIVSAGTALAAALAAILFLSSCSMLSGVMGSFDPLSGVKASVEKRANAEVASGIGLTGMSRKMMFNVIYSQVFFMGGFNPSLYALEETQGAAWRMESKNKDDKKPGIVTSERALLKKNADGSSWWYLSWKSESEEWIFEALMDKAMMAKKIRYFNADVGRVEEAVFDQQAKQDASGKEAEAAPPSEAPASDMSAKDLGALSKGKESVTVGAGTYMADKVVWEWKDEENKDTLTYTWWLDPKAPGGIVKFEWKDKDDSLKGELVSLKKGYATIYKSY